MRRFAGQIASGVRKPSAPNPLHLSHYNNFTMSKKEKTTFSYKAVPPPASYNQIPTAYHSLASPGGGASPSVHATKKSSLPHLPRHSPSHKYNGSSPSGAFVKARGGATASPGATRSSPSGAAAFASRAATELPVVQCDDGSPPLGKVSHDRSISCDLYA